MGTRFRRNPAKSKTRRSCPLCHLLYAPWIEPFFLANIDKPWRDKGDEIHVFRHLRHLPHVNDFPNSRQMFREHKVPWHIAIVPIVATRWQPEVIKHVAERGMVVCVPKGAVHPDIFVIQKVAPRFEASLVKRWVKTCKGAHLGICRPKPPEVEGLRVIDCRSEGRRKKIIEHRSEDPYVTLSYVWGESGATRTMSGSQQADVFTNRARPQPQPGPPMERLPGHIPRTIEDAIRVTLELGYQYLWVDQYCINQSSEEEKTYQFARMGRIYGGSVMTLVALGSHAESGLPGVSDTDRTPQLHATTEHYDLISTMVDPHYEIELSRWATRGWTFQEGLLSKRCLFFTPHQVYYECNAMNCVEVFQSNPSTLHINTRRRFRAFHRAGKYLCGNSNKYSHVQTRDSEPNHRKIDTIRRCEFHVREYSARLLSEPGDALHAFSGVATFYKTTTAKIQSLTGLLIPAPIAGVSVDREARDHLVYALAWYHTHRPWQDRKLHGYWQILNPETQYRVPPPAQKTIRGFGTATHTLDRAALQRTGTLPQLETLSIDPRAWDPQFNPLPKRRQGFPSWSPAGWFGEVEGRRDLPFAWTSLIDSVSMRFGTHGFEPYSLLHGDLTRYEELAREHGSPVALKFKAWILDPRRVHLPVEDPTEPGVFIPDYDTAIFLSSAPPNPHVLRERLEAGTWQVVVLGTHSDPRPAVWNTILAAEYKSKTAKCRRIELMKRRKERFVCCLVVRTEKKPDGSKVCHRRGLVEMRFFGRGQDKIRELGCREGGKVEVTLQ